MNKELCVKVGTWNYAKWYVSSSERDHLLRYGLQNRCGRGDENKHFARGESRVAGFRPPNDIFERKL